MKVKRPLLNSLSQIDSKDNDDDRRTNLWPKFGDQKTIKEEPIAESEEEKDPLLNQGTYIRGRSDKMIRSRFMQ